MAIVLSEERRSPVKSALEDAEEIALSAVTFAEALIVSGRRSVAAEMAELIEGLACEIVPVGEAESKRAAHVYARWGKGIDAAGLNFADYFAYALAQERDSPLLFVGDDFARTDVKRLL